MKEKKKGMSPILIVILSVLCTCLVGFLVYYGVKYFKGEENKSSNPVDEQSNIETNEMIRCGDKSFVVSKDSKTEIENGTGWTGGGVFIAFHLYDDKILRYEVRLNGCEKYDESVEEVDEACLIGKTLTYSDVTDYRCDYLFESHERLANKGEDSMPSGICYSNGKYYEFGLIDNGNTTDVNSWKPYIEDITNYCKTN